MKSVHDKFEGFHKIIHMGGDEVSYQNFDQMPSCVQLLEKNRKIPEATWQNFLPTSSRDLQAYFTKKYVEILVRYGFSPAAWEGLLALLISDNEIELFNN